MACVASDLLCGGEAYPSADGYLGHVRGIRLQNPFTAYRTHREIRVVFATQNLNYTCRVSND